MRIASRLVLPLWILLLGTPGVAQNGAPYRDAARGADERAADLLGRMTLEEKVAQLQGIWKRTSAIQKPDGTFNPDGAAALIGHGIGEIARPSEIAAPPAGATDVRTPRQHVEFVNAVQRWLIGNTRLGIPAMFHE